MMSEPVILLYKSKSCGYCASVSKIWDNSNNNDISISAALKNVNPNVRFFNINSLDRSGKFDENLAPSDLIRYGGVKYPLVLLIPGKSWDLAMQKLGPNNDIKLIEGVKVMNYKNNDGKLELDEKYNILIPSDYERWFQECQNDDDFRKIQYGVNISSVSNSISSNIINKNNNIVPLVNKTNNNNTKKEYNFTNLNNSCAVQFVSKPRPK